MLDWSIFLTICSDVLETCRIIVNGLKIPSFPSPITASFNYSSKRVFAQQNPLLNNPPINPQEATEHPESPHEEQPQNLPDPPETPINPPTDPIDPISSTIPSSTHNLPESSTPIVHILSDDSEADKPDNPPCPITEEKPTRKRKKQIPTFPSFLPKKRTRASTRATTTAIALNPQPIFLKTHTPLPSQTPKFLPVQPTGTETQEPEAQDAATSFSLHQVVVTQEPTTHLVAETQEPTIAVTQEPATAETQEPTTDFIPEIQESDTQGAATVVVTQEPTTHSTVETQEPTADFIPEVQESYAQGVETLFSFHQVAETQESPVDFVAAPQEPTTEAMTVTQKPVTPLDTPMTDQQPKPTMASLLQENEFLRLELEAYK
jgi:hypothetical protein